MTVEDTTAADAAAEAREDAEFASGFETESPKLPEPTKPADQPTAKETPKPAATPRTEATPEPEKFVQISEKDWNEVSAAARRTASYESQLSKLHGTTGKLQEIVKGFQAQTPTGRKVEIPKDAFAAMERDFPELAQMTRTALEAALSGMSGTGSAEVDASKIESMLEEHTRKRELAALVDLYPDWRERVGAVAAGQPPDPNHPFRKWLSTKGADYEARISNAESAAVISRAIRLYQTETKAAPKAPPSARAERIAAAIQPRGDRAGAGGTTEDDEFDAGFRSARG